MRSLIIMPTYNEVDNLKSIVNNIFSYASETHILIVDDNSPDGTGSLADEMSRNDNRIKVMHRSGKLGLGTAYIQGFHYAIAQGYDVVFEMDADFSHDPKYLPEFLRSIREADVVIGSRYIPGGDTPNWSLLRRFISGGGNIFARAVLGLPIKDSTSGYRCFRRKVLENLGLDAIQTQGYGFQVEIVYRCYKQQYRIKEIPIVFFDRRVGKSKMSRKIFLEAFLFVLRTRFARNKAITASVSASENTAAPVVEDVEPEIPESLAAMPPGARV